MDELTVLRLYNDMKEFFAPEELPDWYHEPRRFEFYVKMYKKSSSQSRENSVPI